MILFLPLFVASFLLVRFVVRRNRAKREEADRIAAAYLRALKGNDP